VFRRLLAAWTADHDLPRPRPGRRLRVEPLEAREVPAVTLAAIPDQPVTNNAPQFIPVTVTNTPNGPVNYSVTSDNAAVSASVVQGGRSVRFTVTGRNPDGTDFTGDIVIRLFEQQAPLATGRIIELVNSGFYTSPTVNPTTGEQIAPGRLFHRVSGGFAGPTDTIVQAGSKNGNGTGESGLGELPDEYNPDFRFNSSGIVASANRGDDTTDQQFFIVEPTTPLASRPQFLNFNFTVLGILTAGADVYAKIAATPLTGSTPNSNVVITAASVFADTSNAVLRVDTQAGFTGSARLTVTPSDADGASPAVTALVTGTTANPPDGNRAFLGTLPANLTTTAGTPVTFSVPVVDVDASPLTLDVRDAAFATAPANVTVSINQQARTVTLTPAAGFTGTLNLRVGVRDDVDRSGTGNLNTTANFDTQPLTLTVTAGTGAPQAQVSLSAQPTAATVGQAVTLTAAVTAAGVSNPAGTVEFLNGSTLLATAPVTNGQAAAAVTFAAVGDQSLTARFVPTDAAVVTGNTSAAVSLPVTAASGTATSTTLVVSPQTVTLGGSTDLIATVTADGVTPTGTITFRSGGTTVATATLANGTGRASVVLPTLGQQAITAEYVPADGASLAPSTSAAVTVTVNPTSPLATTVTLTAPGTAPAGTPVTLTATVAVTGGGLAPAGTVQFLSDGTALGTATVGANGAATLSTTFTGTGSRTLTAAFTPADPAVLAASTSGATTLTVAAVATAGITARGARSGEPRVTVLNADGSERVNFLAFDASFTGGVRTAVADVTGDGVPDIVVVPAFGGSPLINVFDSTTGALLASKMIFEESFRGGLTLATGDSTGALGYQRVLVGAGEGGGPRVSLFDFRTDTTILNYFAYDERLRGGVSVAFGTFPNGTGADIVTGSGAGGGPRVNVYDGDTGILMGSRFQGDPNNTAGIGVRVADTDGTGPAILVNSKVGDVFAEDPIDLSFVDFTAPTRQQQQTDITNLLNKSTTTTAN
jgi:cyclophilin family peptidyl-prolyl cis-trans isomerase